MSVSFQEPKLGVFVGLFDWSGQVIFMIAGFLPKQDDIPE